MTEKPILFSAPMVRAILNGTKTQTRRVVTVPWKGSKRRVPYEPYWAEDRAEEGGRLLACDEYGDYHPATEVMHPYGAAGDRLWVRETFHITGASGPDPIKVLYRADGDFPHTVWRPSIFMPRSVCRIELELTGVRIERLQQITGDDAEAEGCTGRTEMYGAQGCRDNFHLLWDRLNAKRGYGWDTNCWVWVLEFKRVK